MAPERDGWPEREVGVGAAPLLQCFTAGLTVGSSGAL